ncbi:MAG: high-potential iron-sulfur protein [Burkholderiales bacterium]|nr:high-potential iron-sulfur protein [Burkholderiales bacterium]
MQQARRKFIQIVPLAGAALLAGRASAQTMVDEKDAQAASLGYVADATRANKSKFPKYSAGQQCSNCALYTGKAADAAGPCGIFPGKQVAAKGWCSAWTKKA